jgi:hypothetical protein
MVPEFLEDIMSRYKIKYHANTGILCVFRMITYYTSILSIDFFLNVGSLSNLIPIWNWNGLPILSLSKSKVCITIQEAHNPLLVPFH